MSLVCCCVNKRHLTCTAAKTVHTLHEVLIVINQSLYVVSQVAGPLLN